MLFCSSCGSQVAENSNFCSRCGRPLRVTVQQPVPTPAESQEIAYYKGEGEVIIKTAKQKGLATKVAVLTFTGPLGFLIWGRDKRSTVRGYGSLIVTNKAIYCAGKEYPFEKIGSMFNQTNSILLEIDVSKNGYRESGWEDVLKSGVAEGYTVELEIRTRDVDRVFNALEQARFSEIKF